MEILRACPLSPAGFQQIESAHKLAGVPRILKHHKHASAPMFGKIKSGSEQPGCQISAPDRGLPRLILRDRVRQMPTSVEKTEQLNALAENLDLTVRCQHQAYVPSAKGSLAM